MQDTEENYGPVLRKHIQRFENAQVIPAQSERAPETDRRAGAVEPARRRNDGRRCVRRDARDGARRARAQVVMNELTGELTAFHTKVGGDVSKISALFSDLTPEPQVSPLRSIPELRR